MSQAFDLAKSAVAPQIRKGHARQLAGDDFYALFLDPSRTYSTAKFYSPAATLEQAQYAKIDMALAKSELKPGLRVLDIGCGWGAAVIRAAQRHEARVTGLTIGQTEHAYCLQLAQGKPNIEFKLESWEEHNAPTDRILCIDALAYFGRKKYGPFFAKCRSLLPEGGVLIVQTITQGRPEFDEDFLRFAAFLAKYIFPTGDIPSPEVVLRQARLNRFEIVSTESLRLDHVQTLEAWATNLNARRERAIAAGGETNYMLFRRYFEICADYFRANRLGMHQIKLRAI